MILTIKLTKIEKGLYYAEDKLVKVSCYRVENGWMGNVFSKKERDIVFETDICPALETAKTQITVFLQSPELWCVNKDFTFYDCAQKGMTQ